MTLDFLSRIEKKISLVTGLSIFDIIYAIDLIAIFIGANKFSLNSEIFNWEGLNIGDLFYDVGMLIYSNNAPIIGIIFCVVIVLMALGADNDKMTKVLDLLPKEVEYTDNTVGGYNPWVAIKRLLNLMWFIYHNLWIIFLTLVILTGKFQLYITNISMENSEAVYYLLLIFNFIYLLFLLVKRLFYYRIPRYLHHKKIDDINNKSHYLIINQFEFKGTHYYFVKDLLLDNPLFYFAKEEDLGFANKMTIIVNSSRNFEEIKYEFDAEMKNRGLDRISKLTAELSTFLKRNDDLS